METFLRSLQFNVNADLRLADSVVSGNKSAADGGGISVSTAAAVLTLTNSVVQNNQATGSAYDGGGINVQAASLVTITGSTISGNTSADDGAGIYFFNGGALMMDSSIVSGNTAATGTSNDGGGIYMFGVTAIIRNSTAFGLPPMPSWPIHDISKLAYPGPFSVLRPRFPGRSESGLPSRLASEPAKMLYGLPLSTDSSELILKLCSMRVLRGISLIKARVKR